MEKIKRNYLIEELKSSSNFQNLRIFYKTNNQWLCHDENALTIDELNALKNNLTKEYTHLKKGINKVIYKINNGEIFVEISVKKGCRELTLKKNHLIIKKCFTSADRSFYANHDPLTGLLNRNGAKNEYEKKFNLISNSAPEEDDENAVASSQLNKIALIAFDIDHFKQINDSYSHDHGDVILKVFADRLYDYLPKLEEKFQCQFILSRPGGEEFELLILGEVDKALVDLISQAVKNELQNPLLPEKAEFDRAVKILNLEIDGYTGSISSSIGTALQSKLSSGDYLKIYSSLRAQADAALNRAKNDGRDCIRHYEDISRKHGKVYQHHSDSDIVIIDIGTKVGVYVGYKYKVYYPPFDGNRQVLKHDGRSEKKLGDYPRIDSAELVVIQAQEKISVCEIVSKVNQDKIPESSSIEYVPLGSFPRLIKDPRGLQNWPSCGKTSDLISSIDNRLRAKTLGGVLKFIIEPNTNVDKIRADLLVSLTQNLPPCSQLFMANPYALYVVIPTNKDFKTTVTEFMKEIKGFNCGAVSLMDLPNEYVKTPESLLYFCSLTLSYLEHQDLKEKNVDFFTKSMATMAIRTWMEAEAVEDAIADYGFLSRYGVKSAQIDNQLGLVLLRENIDIYGQRTEELFKQAHTAAPTLKTIELNLALSKVLLGKYKDAYEIFNKHITTIETLNAKGYILGYGVSAIECYKNGDGVTFSKVKNIIERALTDLPSVLGNRNLKWKKRLESFTEI